MLCDSEKRYVQPQAVSEDGLDGPMTSPIHTAADAQIFPKKMNFREWRLAHVPFETGAIRATHRDF